LTKKKKKKRSSVGLRFWGVILGAERIARTGETGYLGGGGRHNFSGGEEKFSPTPSVVGLLEFRGRKAGHLDENVILRGAWERGPFARSKKKTRVARRRHQITSGNGEEGKGKLGKGRWTAVEVLSSKKNKTKTKEGKNERVTEGSLNGEEKWKKE